MIKSKLFYSLHRDINEQKRDTDVRKFCMTDSCDLKKQPVEKMLSGRYFLLLQGPQSVFFRKLSDALKAQGARVEKVNFCGGDLLLWGLTRRCINYSGTLYEWPEWIGSYYREHGVTDICLYGDWRPLHWEAVRLAYVRGIRVWVFEEGYLRAGFSTLEENGVNGRSSLPMNPQDIREMAIGLPDPEQIKVENDIQDKVVKAIVHHTGNVCFWPKFRHYRTHRPSNIFFELIGILPRYLRRHSRQQRSKRVLEAFNQSDAPYFFYPLQLVSDSQVQLYSPYVRVQEAIADVLTSFAVHAHPKTRLLIKNHPLDNGLIDYGAFIVGFASELGIADRVTYVEDGSTEAMIAGSRGVVLINSTVGLMALDQNKPVYCLGRSIYNIEGLTQSLPTTPLDLFWRAPKVPSRTLYRAFKRVLYAQALIHGNFYSPSGIELAVKDTVKRLVYSQSRIEPKHRQIMLRSRDDMPFRKL